MPNKIIKAVCWTESNLLGLFISLKFINISQQNITLYIFISNKITSKESDIVNLFKKIDIRDIYIIKANNNNFIYFYLSIFSIKDFINYLLKRREFISLLPSPMNPPSRLFLLGKKYYYGDGLGSKPVFDYAWFPNLSNLSIKQKIRYFLLKMMNNVSDFLLFNKKNYAADISLDKLLENKLIKKSFIFEVMNLISKKFIQNDKTIIDGIFYESKFHSTNKEIDNKNIIFYIVVLSTLSPSRVKLSDELLLYEEYLNYIIDKSKHNKILFKFHIHHSKYFKNKVLGSLRSKNFNVQEIETTKPIEIFLIYILKKYSNLKIEISSFQESTFKLKLLLDNLDTKFKLNFGFPNHLINKYFREDEKLKRLRYQENMLKRIENI